MVNNNCNDKILKICESLIHISEGTASIDEIDVKLNTIMDALGLTDETEAESEQEETNKDDETMNIDDEPKIDNPFDDKDGETKVDNNSSDELIINEGLDSDGIGYEINFNRNAKNHDNWGVQNQKFSSLSELKHFILKNNLPISSRELKQLEEADKEKSNGKLLVTLYFSIIKK